MPDNQQDNNKLSAKLVLERKPNKALTPHIGAGTQEASARGEWGAARDVISVLEGNPPKNPVLRFD